jgi:hypothetical protein
MANGAQICFVSLPSIMLLAGNGRGGRCKLHGGMSTGPKTEQGRERLREPMKHRWRRKRSEDS